MKLSQQQQTRKTGLILSPQTQQQSKKNKILLTIFIISVIGFIILVYNRPSLTNHHDIFQEITFPPTVQHLQKLSYALIDYKNQHPFFSIVMFVYLYTLLQAFAIPGPIFLCILSPTLFGAYPGFFISLSCSCLGASLCYFLSYTLARSLVLRKFPDLFKKFNNMVNAHRHNLFWYMMFLRLTPLIPNWFVNLGSPLVGMPYIYFIVASFIGVIYDYIGLMPNNFILTKTGLTLKEIESIGMGPQNFITLIVLGFLALIPTFFSKKYQKQNQYQKVQS